MQGQVRQLLRRSSVRSARSGPGAFAGAESPNWGRSTEELVLGDY